MIRSSLLWQSRVPVLLGLAAIAPAFGPLASPVGADVQPSSLPGLTAHLTTGLLIGQAADPASERAAIRTLNAAASLLERGLNDLAADEYRTFLERWPNHVSSSIARYGCGLAYIRQKKWDDAERVLAPALKADADTEYACESLVLLGQARLETEAKDDAARPFAIAIERFPEHRLALTARELLVDAHLRDKKFADAAKAADSMVASAKKNEATTTERAAGGRVARRLASAWASKGDDANIVRWSLHAAALTPAESASRAYTLLAARAHHRTKSLDDASRLYEALTRNAAGEPAADINAAESWYGLALIADEQSRHDDVIGAAQQAERSNELTGKPGYQASLDRVVARAAFATQKYDLAATRHDAIAAAGDADMCDHFTRALCDLRQGNSGAAADHLSAVLEQAEADETNPIDNADACVLAMRRDLIVARLESGDDAGAFAAASNAVARHPDPSRDLFRLAAWAAFRAGDHDAAMESVDAYRAIPGDEASEEAIAVELIAADAASALDDRTRSSRALANVLDRNPDHPDKDVIRLRLAFDLHTLGNEEAAFEQLDPLLTRVLKSPEPGDAALDLPAAFLLKGDHALRASGPENAIQPLREARDRAQKRSDRAVMIDASLLLARAERLVGEGERAVAVLDRLVQEIDADSLDRDNWRRMMYERGVAFESMDDAGEAVTVLQALTTRDRTEDIGFDALRRSSLEHLAAAAMRDGQFLVASNTWTELESLLTQPAERLEASWQRAVASESAGNHAETLDRYLAVAEQMQAADEDTRVAFPRERSDALLRAAFASIRLEDDQRITKVVPMVLADPSTSDAISRPVLMYATIRSYRMLDDDDSAASLTNALLAEAPDAPESVFAAVEESARLLDGDEDADDIAITRATARPLLEFACEKLSSETSSLDAADRNALKIAAFGRRARQRLIAGDMPGAAADADIVIGMNPPPAEDVMIANRMIAAEALTATGRLSDAATQLEAVRAAKIDPALRESATFRLAECRTRLQEWKSAETLYRSILETEPKSRQWFRAAFGLGWSLEQQSRYAPAIAVYESVIAGHEGTTAARSQFQIGECHFAQGDFEEAVRAFLRTDAAYNAPEWQAAALYEAARCFRSLNRAADADQQMDRLVRRFPESAWTKRAQREAAGGGVNANNTTPRGVEGDEDED